MLMWISLLAGARALRSGALMFMRRLPGSGRLAPMLGLTRARAIRSAMLAHHVLVMSAHVVRHATAKSHGERQSANA
jgi:hypothetical protein